VCAPDSVLIYAVQNSTFFQAFPAVLPQWRIVINLNKIPPSSESGLYLLYFLACLYDSVQYSFFFALLTQVFFGTLISYLLNENSCAEVHYEILEDEHSANFSIDPRTGEVRPRTGLDFEAIPAHLEDQDSRALHITIRYKELSKTSKL
jgi:hypothetical protein